MKNTKWEFSTAGYLEELKEVVGRASALALVQAQVCLAESVADENGEPTPKQQHFNLALAELRRQMLVTEDPDLAESDQAIAQVVHECLGQKINDALARAAHAGVAKALEATQSDADAAHGLKAGGQ